MHNELTEDHLDMVYADSAAEVERRRKAFLRQWWLKCRAVADRLEEAGDRLFTFTRRERADIFYSIRDTTRVLQRGIVPSFWPWRRTSPSRSFWMSTRPPCNHLSLAQNVAHDY